MSNLANTRRLSSCANASTCQERINNEPYFKRKNNAICSRDFGIQIYPIRRSHQVQKLHHFKVMRMLEMCLLRAMRRNS